PPHASSQAALADASREQTPLLTPISPASAEPSTLSSPLCAPVTSAPSLLYSIPTLSSLPTLSPSLSKRSGKFAAQRIGRREPSSPPAAHAPHNRRSSTAKSASSSLRKATSSAYFASPWHTERSLGSKLSAIPSDCVSSTSPSSTHNNKSGRES